MTTIRNFSLFDLLDYNNINLDITTETVRFSFKIKQQKVRNSILWVLSNKVARVLLDAGCKHWGVSLIL